MPASTRLTFGSLFAGIGGLDLGLERAGMECRWQVENDPYCLKVLSKHWPDVKKYGDIKKIDFENVEKVDLICGGFPCPPVSVAGKRKGMEDERWLWSDFFRAVCVLRPEYVLVENVPGLLSANHGRAMGQVVGNLAQIGYRYEWDCLPARTFGAPHKRRRLFIVAYSNSKGLEGSIRWTKRRCFQANNIPSQSFWAWENWPKYVPTPYLVRNYAGIPFGVDRIKCLGNAVVPQVAEWIGKQIMRFDNDPYPTHT